MDHTTHLIECLEAEIRQLRQGLYNLSHSVLNSDGKSETIAKAAIDYMNR